MLMQFGTVFLGRWRGGAVAVKCITIPSSASHSIKAENMAVSGLADARWQLACLDLSHNEPICRL